MMKNESIKRLLTKSKCLHGVALPPGKEKCRVGGERTARGLFSLLLLRRLSHQLIQIGLGLVRYSQGLIQNGGKEQPAVLVQFQRLLLGGRSRRSHGSSRKLRNERLGRKGERHGALAAGGWRAHCVRVKSQEGRCSKKICVYLDVLGMVLLPDKSA